MKGRILGSFVLALALFGSTFVSAPDAQVSIQRGFGPSIPAGSGSALAGLGGVLTVSTTSAQTPASTVETDLWTYSLPANTLSANNYGVRIAAWGSAAANANNKRVRLYFGSTLVVDTALRSLNNGAWRVTSDVFRKSTSSQVADGIWRMAGIGSDITATSPSEVESGAITIRVSGQNSVAAAGDIVFIAAVIEFLRPGS